MDKVKVIVKGAGSLEVEGVEAFEIYKAIDFHLGIEKKYSVHKVKRGPKKKFVTTEQ